MRVYIDSDILIWHLRGKKRALNFLKKLSSLQEYELWIGALQRAEVVFFMKPDEEDGTHLFLSQFKTAAVDQILVDYAGQIFRKWHASHGVDANDAFLAATVMQSGGILYSLNIKHYPMPEIVVKKPW